VGSAGAVVGQLLGGVNVPIDIVRSPRHARATSPSESGDQRDTHGSYGAHVRPSAPRPRTTSALRRRERCTMPRRRTPMCRAPMCGPRTWLTDQSHEMGDGRPRCLPPSRQRWPAPPRRVRPCNGTWRAEGYVSHAPYQRWLKGRRVAFRGHPSRRDLATQNAPRLVEQSRRRDGCSRRFGREARR
jgi:hypothetical protein